MKIRVNFDADLPMSIVAEGGKQAIYEAANALLAESKKQVPLDWGTLQGSGTVSQSPDGLTANVSYDTPYAARWHEQDANFQRGRKKKYLEDPLNDPGFKQQLANYVAQHIKF